MPINVNVYAEVDPIVEITEETEDSSEAPEITPSEGSGEDEKIHEVPDEMPVPDEGEEEAVPEITEDIPTETGEGNMDIPDIEDEAVYIVFEELEAVQVFGAAATSPEMAAASLQEATSLDNDTIDEAIEELFLKAENDAPEEDDLVPSMDGTQIEDNFAAKWVTSDTSPDNENSALLYLRPGN